MSHAQKMTQLYHWGCALAEAQSEERPYSALWERRLIVALDRYLKG